MFDSDNKNALPNTQDWGNPNPWPSNAASYQVDQKRLALLSESSGPQSHAYYWQYMNPCGQQEGLGLKPGMEPWQYPTPTAMSTPGTSGAYSNRNVDMLRQNPLGPPSRPPHHLFATNGGAIPLSEGGPPSLPPSLLLHPFPLQIHPQERSSRTQSRYPWETVPPYCASQTIRQRTGIDTPPRFSSNGNTIYPPSSLFHYDSMSTAPPLSTLPYYSAFPFGISSGNFRSQTNLNPVMQNPDSINYADHGCYSLPVTTATCDHQSQVNETIRPCNLSSTSVVKQSATVAHSAPDHQRQSHHRRTLSDPGVVFLASLESNIIPSNPPPPPPLRLDGWLKEKVTGGVLSNRRFDEPSVSSTISETNRWFHSSEERKEHRLEQSKADEEVLRINASGHSSSGSDVSGALIQPLKSASNVHHTKSTCCCSSWSSSKVAEELSALKEANRKICRELRETRKELDDLKVMLPNPGSLKNSNGLLSWQYPGMDYQPGMIAELVQEVRDAARVREEAFLSHIHSSIASQGSSCGCGQALFQDGDDFGKKKLSCWWWGKNYPSQNKSRQQQTSPTCSPVTSSVSATSQNKSSPGTAELENLKERLQQVQDEKEQTNVRLKRLEEELNSYKLLYENHTQRSTSLQESDIHIQMKNGDKVTLNESSGLRQRFYANKNEDLINQEVALIKDDVQKLRLQLQNLTTTRDTTGHVQKIEQLTALLQKVICSSNGISMNTAGSSILSTIGCCTCGPGKVDDNLCSDELPLINKTNSTGVYFDKIDNNVTSASGSREDIVVDQTVATDLSPPNSIESDCSSSSSCSHNSNIDISAGLPPPVTMHGPVTDL